MRRVLYSEGVPSFEIFPAAELRPDDLTVDAGPRFPAAHLLHQLSADARNTPVLQAALADAQERCVSLPPGEGLARLGHLLASGQVRLARYDALPVIRFMVGEINRNASSADARKIRQFNFTNRPVCLAELRGLPLWPRLLAQGLTPGQWIGMMMPSGSAAILAWSLNSGWEGPWNYSERICENFNPRCPGGRQYWHQLGRHFYWYSIWQCLHYGYVGAACGFKEAMLLDGAAPEQGALPSWLRAAVTLPDFPDPSYRAGIRMGVRLYSQQPYQVTTAQLIAEIQASPGVEKRPVVTWVPPPAAEPPEPPEPAVSKPRRAKRRKAGRAAAGRRRQATSAGPVQDA